MATTVANDAFGRLRVGLPETLQDSRLTYDLAPLLWETTIVGTGSCTHLPNESAALLAVAASGDSVVRQSRYVQYRPGKSQLVLMTGTAIQTPNVRCRIGYFDDRDGLYFEITETDVKVVVRSSTTGAVVNTAVSQANWNIDQVDGVVDRNNVSGQLLSPGTANIFGIDFEWLGVGVVRWYVAGPDGLLRMVHITQNPGANLSTYMRTASLPLRFSIEATGVTTAKSMRQICTAVMAEGGENPTAGQVVAAGTGITTTPVTTRRNVLTIRPKATFNSIVNRSRIDPVGFDLYSSADCYYEVVRGGTLGGSPSYTSAGTNSAVEWDQAGTTVTGGDVVSAGFIATAGGATKASTRVALSDLGLLPLPLALDAAGSNPTNFSLVVTAISGTVATSGALSWTEVR